MAEIQIHKEIAELLKPISSKNPTGEDISKSEDPVANAAFTDLEMEISKIGEINYQKTIKMASDILLKQSKHIRVAAWLCLSWFKLEGAGGLKKGLQLILELLRTFSDKLFPEKTAHRSKAVQFVNLDKRFQTFGQAEISDPETLNEIRDIFQEIVTECDKQFSDYPPNLSNFSQLISSQLEKVKDSKPAKEPAAEDKKITESAATSQDQEAQPESDDSVPAEAEEQGDEQLKVEEETPPEKEIEISAEVSELLEDIDSKNPAGENIENSENQEALVLYLNLESEIAKYSNNNYHQCIKWAEEILQTYNKHLRVVMWLMISWFRTENLSGFRNGIQLILEMLKKYGAQCHPVDQKQKSRILQTLNTETRLKIFERIKSDRQNAEVLVEIGELFSALVEQANNLLPDMPPKLNVITDIIKDNADEAGALLEADKKQELQREEKPVATVSQEEPKPVSQTSAEKSILSTAIPAGTASSISINDEKSAKIAIKKALSFYFEDGTQDSSKRRIPEDPTVYALSRDLRWGKCNQPPDNENITQIAGPNEPKQKYILKLYTNKDWDALIPELEINFITNDSFTFWLDAQRYVIEALEQKGGSLNEVATEIKIHLACLISKLPGLTKLIFNDAHTPFAGKKTAGWIQEEVMSSFGGGKSKEKILPPIIGEDYEQINKIYEAVCEELPENFATNVKSMQQAIDGETRKKGRFLRLLNLANYCYLAKKYLLAQPFFDQLMDQIETYHIKEWETALCVSVWQSTFLNNQKLLSDMTGEQKKTIIENQQKELFDKIVKYDAVLALNLENHIENKGE